MSEPEAPLTLQSIIHQCLTPEHVGPALCLAKHGVHPKNIMEAGIQYQNQKLMEEFKSFANGYENSKAYSATLGQNYARLFEKLGLTPEEVLFAGSEVTACSEVIENILGKVYEELKQYKEFTFEKNSFLKFYEAVRDLIHAYGLHDEEKIEKVLSSVREFSPLYEY